MSQLEVYIENFLSIKSARLKANANITFIIAPNRAGKTQLLLLLYTYYWSLWKLYTEGSSSNASKIFKEKLKGTFLVKKLTDLIKWNENNTKVLIKDNLGNKLEMEVSKSEINFPSESSPKQISLTKSPVYLSPAGLGDYYKGIWAIKKYYKSWRLFSEAVTDLLEDLFIVASESAEVEDETQKLLELFERLFNTKYHIRQKRIYISESGKTYGLEKTASGLKSLAWYYLLMKYNLLSSVLFIDEPEVNLHPEYIDRLVRFLYELSRNRKVFVATHSDYLLESFNVYLKKKNIEANVWVGMLKEDGAYYRSYTAGKDKLIDTTPLNKTYTKIVEELFKYEM